MTFSELVKKYKLFCSKVKKGCLNYEIYVVTALQSQTGKMNYKQKGKAKAFSRSLDPKYREIATLKKQ